MTHSPSRLPLSALFLAVAALAGCNGGDADAPPAPAPAPAPTPAPAPAPTAQTISFTSPGNQTIGTPAPALSATTPSTLPVILTSTTAPVCTVSGTELTLVTPGTCTIEANQAGGTSGGITYSAAATVSVSFTVAPMPPLAFASGYKDIPGVAIRTNEDGDVGQFNDGTRTWGVDFFAPSPDQGVSNWATGLGFAPIKDATYFGVYVKGPANGTVNAAGYTSINIKLWGNSELFNLQPNIKMILQGPPVVGCGSNSGGAEIVATFKADQGFTDTGAYSVPISSFTVQAACGSGTTVQTILATVAQVNYVLDVNNINFTTPTGGPWANYLNIGSITFN